MSLNVLILSAGIGSRFKLKNQKPKALIKIGNKSLIERLLDILIELKLKNFYIAVGYKKELIKNALKKYNKKVNIKYIHIKDYKKVGSSYSFYKYKNHWLKKKKDTLLIHSDLFCHKNLIKDVINSRYKNIIGSFQKKTDILKKGWIIKKNSNHKIYRIYKTLYKKNKTFNEISCINKFSTTNLKKLFLLMESYFKNISNKDTWEILINKFIIEKEMYFYSNHNTSGFWFNINTKADLKKARNYNLKEKGI